MRVVDPPIPEGDEDKTMTEQLPPRTHAEAVALFRHGVIGALAQAEMDRGQLAAALEELSKKRFVPPRAKKSRTFSEATLERWYYAFKKHKLEGLKPRRRKDRGRAKKLKPEAKKLLCDVRREHPSASVPVILRTLQNQGQLETGVVSATTLRRLYVDEGLDRIAARDGSGPKTRLRWQAERPGALWHGDVCYGPALKIAGKFKPLRIHGLLDDASRYVVALEAHHTEREVDMLGIFVRALRRHGPPDAFYLDNGSTYRGDTLATACARIGISLMHARPYDPEARGKMERFWRTLREGCLDFLGSLSSLHDVNVRLWAFLDAHYHVSPHAGLLGKTPATVFQGAPPRLDGFDEAKLREALTTRARRRVRRDCTVTIAGKDYELDGGHLAGRIVELCRCLVDLSELPWVEFEGKRLPVHPVDVVKNSRRRRQARRPAHDESAPTHPAFNPPQALLDKALGRRPRREGGES
jgi:transposase InsO family protein